MSGSKSRHFNPKSQPTGAMPCRLEETNDFHQAMRLRGLIYQQTSFIIRAFHASARLD